MRDKRRKSTPPGSEPPAVAAAELPERWSAGRKTELVLRLLRGEALDAVSRESQVPAHELESWKRVFLEQDPTLEWGVLEYDQAIAIPPDAPAALTAEPSTP